MKDHTISQFFMTDLIKADREMFDTVILREEHDSIVLMYSTEENNYLQRKGAYQFNLAAKTLSVDSTYKDLVPGYLKFYEFDTNVHGFPKGIPAMTAPPEDLYGQKVFTKD